MSRSSLYPPSVDPGFPSLGVVPTGWTRATFGNALEKVERPLDLEPNRRYRLVTAKRSRGGIVLRSELLGREILTKTQFVASAGDFLISRRQIIHGACGVVPEDLDGAVVSNEYSTLRTRPGLLMDYLRHYCHTSYFQRTCFHSSHGVDVEKMIFKIDEWLAREVDLPPVEEQRKIAAILSSVDDAIEASHAVIDQLQVVKKAMMAELLTKGLPGRHKKFKQTEIGQVPADWSVELLDSLIAAGRPICYGVLKPGPHFEGGIPVVRITDYKGDRLDPAQVQCSAPGVVAPFARSTLAEGDILVSIRGTAGRVCVVPREIHGGNVSRDSARISIRDPDLRTFIYCYLRSPAAQGFVMGEMRGLAVKGINIEDLRRLPVPIPPPPERDTIATGIHAIDELLRASQEKLAKMAEVKSALMSVLLTGEVRVRVDEKAAA